MSDVIKRYFVADGERAKQVATDGLELVNAARNKRSAYLDKIGADGLWERRNRAPFGIVHYSKSDQQPGFLKPEQQRDGEKTCWVHRPDKRTTIGKEVLKALAGLATFDFSDYACKAFDVSHSVIGAHGGSPSGLAMYSSVAGVIKGQMVFCIPFGGDDRNSDIDIPAELREIKKSEYIALTEEGEVTA